MDISHPLPVVGVFMHGPHQVGPLLIPPVGAHQHPARLGKGHDGIIFVKDWGEWHECVSSLYQRILASAQAGYFGAERTAYAPLFRQLTKFVFRFVNHKIHPQKGLIYICPLWLNVASIEAIDVR